WGQWIRKTDTGEKPRAGQYGVLGTAAGLELICSCHEFDDAQQRQGRIELIASAWKYLADRLVAPEDGQPDARASLVTRQTQVIRGLSALEMHVPKLRQVSSLDAFQDDRNRRLAIQVLDDLREARATSLKSVSDLNANSEEDRVGGFRFS